MKLMIGESVWRVVLTWRMKIQEQEGISLKYIFKSVDNIINIFKSIKGSNSKLPDGYNLTDRYMKQT